MSWFSKNTLFYLLSVLIVLGVFAGDPIEKFAKDTHSSIVLNRFKNAVLEAEKQTFSLLDSLSSQNLNENIARFKQLESRYLNKGIAFYIYNHDSLKLWSNIEALPPSYFIEFYRPTYYESDNGSYLFFVKSNDDNHWVVSINLAHHYLFSNKYLAENSPLNEQIANYFRFGKPGRYSQEITLSSGQVICSLQPKESKQSANAASYILFGLFILTILLASKNAYKILAVCILFVAQSIFGINESFNKLELFQPTLYAGSFLFGGLGNLLFALFAAYSLSAFVKSEKIRLWLFYLSSVLLAALVYDLSKNSIITLETSDIFGLSAWSFISFLCVAIILWLLTKLEPKSFTSIDKWALLVATSISLTLVVLSVVGYIIILFPVSLFLIRFLFKSKELDQTQSLLLKAFILSTLAFVIIEKTEFDKNRKQIPLLVKNLVNQRDHIAEFLLADFRKTLIDDAYVKRFFTNPFLPKSTIEERLKKLYLRAYLKKFNHQVLFVPRKVKFGYTPERDLAESIENIISYKGFRVSEGVYTTKLTGITNAYLTEQHFTENKDTIGSLYVLLSEKSFYDQSIYPELLIGDNENKSSEKLHYAFYKNGSLITTIGSLSFPLFINNDKNSIEKELNRAYKHYFYSPEPETTFIISTEKSTALHYASSFSVFLFLVFLFLFLLLWGQKGLYWLPRINLLWKKTSFSNRIRVSTLGAVLLALLVLGYATSVYTQKNYETESEKVLVSKAKKANLYFSNLLKANKSESINPDVLQESVLQFSELYEADLDLYNKHGQLIASSQKIIYENGILEKQLDGNAFFEINYKGKSLYLKEEKIGLLNYISAFAPVLENGNIEGFVQLPYFRRQEDLRQDQASFFVALFNIYLIILVLLGLFTAFLLRTLTKPLSLITRQLQQTSLIKNNEKIAWDKQDEIGLLIEEYNNMVDKLELSAKQLAENKQAEAWQEMARQVAHEIKNPLTPMKLNIQQLQRAWKDQHHSLDKIFDKVTNILVNQIESLSRIASEFSSFAKMPTLKLEQFKLSQIFEEIAQLYNVENDIVEINNQCEGLIINADKDQVFRALNNIVKNGIQSVSDPKEAKIIISLEQKNDDKATITISDNGSGISESQKEKIFIPNFSTKSSGMGLGLAIVRQTIENHKGSISFSTQINVGTKFEIVIPINQNY